MPDKTLGQILHEAREAGGQQRPRPWPPLPWAERDPALKELDEAMAAAVAAAERERLRVLIAERFKTVLMQPGNGYLVDAVPWSALAGLLTSGLEARSEGGEA